MPQRTGSSGDDLVLIHREIDPVMASIVADALATAHIEFATREFGPDLSLLYGGSGPVGTELWVLASDVDRARAVLEVTLARFGTSAEDEEFDAPDLPDGELALDPFPSAELPTLFWRRTDSGAFVLHGPVAAYARLAPRDGAWTDAIVEVAGGTWRFTTTNQLPRHLIVDNYLERDRLGVELDAREPVPLVRENTGAPYSPLLLGRAGTWETEDDWLIRLHDASGTRTVRWRVEVDPTIAGRPEILLLLAISAFSRNGAMPGRWI